MHTSSIGNGIVCENSVSSANLLQSDNTPFADLPSTITGASATYCLASETVPDKACHIYQVGEETWTFYLKRGSGNIVFIGFDFFSKSDEWSNVLRKSFELDDKSVTCDSISVSKNNDPCKSGGITFTPEQGNGTITDGSGSANYDNSLRCTYTFDNNNQDAKLIIEFKSFSLEKDFDFLQVFNNPSRSKESNVALISGSGQPKSMVLTNPVNVLVFTSDCNNGFPGFEINYFWVIKQTVLPPDDFDQPTQPVVQVFRMKNRSQVPNLTINNNTSQQIESKLKNQDIVTMDGVVGYILSSGIIFIVSGAFWWFVGYRKIKVQNKRDKRNSERLVFTSVQIPETHSRKVKPQKVCELENISHEIKVGETTYPSFWQDSSYDKIWRFVHVATDYPKFIKMCNTLKVKYWNSPYISQNIRGRGRSRSNSFRFTNLVVIPDDVRAVVFDVLQHRIGISYEAEAENMSSVDIITKIVNEIAVP